MRTEFITRLVAASLLGGLGILLLLAMPLSTLTIGKWLLVFVVMKCAALGCIAGALAILRRAAV